MKKGFTLAELLIALAILGVIATFTIPKVLQSQQSSEWKAAGKEAAATLSGAYQAYKSENDVSANTTSADLTPYINYVKVDTTTVLDSSQGEGDWACSNTAPCLLMHNGGMFHYESTEHFNGTANNNCIAFGFDPDGKSSGSATGPGKHVGLFLFYNGRLTTEDGINPSCNSNMTTYNNDASKVPPWFSWEN